VRGLIKSEGPNRSRETRASGAGRFGDASGASVSPIGPRFDQPASGRLRHPLGDAPLSATRPATAPEPREGASTPIAVPDLGESLSATLREAIERHGSGAVLLCSFQKEESVLVEELLRIEGPPIRVRIVTIDTGVLFEETLETWRAFEKRFGIAVEVFDASAPEGDRWTGPEHCCSQAKVAALERALDGAEGWITGIRREQGPTRAATELLEHDQQRGLWKYNPLAHWTEKDLWRRIHERELPYNPLHDQGYASIGCEPCTQPGSGREGRWVGTDKTECGLHVVEAVR
jgi:phosphoadenosine phosphosulfate reductase